MDLLALFFLLWNLFCSAKCEVAVKQIFEIAIVLEDQDIVDTESIKNLVHRRINYNWKFQQTSWFLKYSLYNASNSCNGISINQKICEKNQPFFNVIIAIGSCNLLNNLISLGTAMHVPTIAIPTNFCDLKVTDYTIVQRELTEHHILNAAKIFQNKKTSFVTILYDNDQSLKTVQTLHSQLTQHGVKSISIEIRQNNTIAVLQGLKENSHNFIILAKKHVVLDILNISKETGMQQENYLWVIFDTGLALNDIKSASFNNNDMPNILLIRGNTNNLISQSTLNCKQAVVDVFPNCNPILISSLTFRLLDALESLASVIGNLTQNSTHHLNSTAACLPTTLSQHGHLLRNNLLSIVRLNTFRSVISYNMSNKHLQSEYIENIATFTQIYGQKTQFTESSRYYVNKDKLTVTFTFKNQHLVFPNTFISFKNRTLIFCTNSAPGYGVHTEKNSDGSVKMNGLIPEIINILQKHLDFQVIYRPSPDGFFGGPVPGSKYYSGCIGELQKGNAQMSGPFVHTTIRSLGMDYTENFMESSNSMILRRPPKTSKLWNVFIPLQPAVWCLILVFCILASMITYFVAKYSPYTAYNLGLSYAIADEVWLKEYLWAVIGSFLQQGQDFYPHCMSARTMLAFWWMFTLIIFAAYTGDLTAHLAITKTNYPIQQLEELVQRPWYKALIVEHGNLYTLIAQQTSGIYHQLKSQMILTKNLQECAEKVIKENNPYQVCLSDLGILQMYAKQYCQDVYLAKGRFNFYTLGIGVPKDSYYLNAVNFLMKNLKNVGLANYLQRKYFIEVADCSFEEVVTGAEPIELEEIGGICVLMLVLYVVGFIILLLELAWVKILNKKPLQLPFY